MNDVEQRLREGLSSGAERFRQLDRTTLGPPRLGATVRRRVRRRQLGTVAVALAMIAGLAVGSFEAVSQFTRSAQTLPASQPVTGTQQAPPGWPLISFGDTKRPTVEYSPGQRAELTGPKVLVAYGSFSAPTGQRGTWYIDVYTEKRGLYPNNDVVYRTGQCEEISLRVADGGGGGGGGCGSGAFGQGSDRGREGSLDSGCCDDGFAEYDGALSRTIARVEIRPNGTRPFDLTILPGPPGYDVNYFFFLAPKNATGEALAFDANGTLLERATFCAPSMSSLPNIGRFFQHTRNPSASSGRTGRGASTSASTAASTTIGRGHQTNIGTGTSTNVSTSTSGSSPGGSITLGC